MAVGAAMGLSSQRGMKKRFCLCLAGPQALREEFMEQNVDKKGREHKMIRYP